MKQNRDILNSPRLKELKRKKNIAFKRKLALFILLFAAIFTGLSYLSKWRELNIETIEIRGNKVIDTEIIEKVIRENLTGRYLWLFPKTNSLLYPKNKIKDALTTNLHRLKDISLEVKDTKTLVVNLAERTSAYTWCGNELPENNQKPEENKCYFMDEEGYIFDEAPYFSDEVYFKFFGATNKLEENPIGSTFLPNNFKKLVSLIEDIKNTKLKPSSLLVKDNDNIELYLSSNTPPPNAPKILFKNDSDFLKVAENLQTVIATEPLQSDLKNKYSSLVKIDLRFGNKVYFKFK